jgi:uncharacterized protein
MAFGFDPAKNAINITRHGLSLADAAAFDFDDSYVEVDRRFAYGEVRYRAFGRIDGLGYCLAFTTRAYPARVGHSLSV